MFVFFVNALLQNTMAEQNVPAQPPTRTDEQIVPRSQWLTIGKEKTSGCDKPDTQFCNMLMLGNSHSKLFDHDELIWEEFTQGIQTFFSHIAQPKAEYKENCLKEVSSHVPATKRATPKKPTTTTPVKQTKPAPPPSKKPSKRKLPQKVRKGKPAFQLVDEEDEAQQESIPQREDDEKEGDNADLCGRAKNIKLSCLRYGLSRTQGRAHVVGGRSDGSGINPTDHCGIKLLLILQLDLLLDPMIDTSEKGVSISCQSDPEGKKAHEALAGPDPEPMNEDQTRSDSGKLHVSLAGPNPEHMDDEFLATAYPKMSHLQSLQYSDTPHQSTRMHTTITHLSLEITFIHALQKDIPVPTAVDNYLGTKLDDALLKVLETTHWQDFIEKYSALPGPESVKIRIWKETPKEIIKAIKEQEQGERPHDESNDSDDDNDEDDDVVEGPSAGANQGRSKLTRRRSYLCRFWITDTREAGVDSSMHRSDPESEHSEQSSDDISMQDEGNRTGKRSSAKMDECHKLLTNKVDLSNPEGHQIPQNLNEPLPLGGPPGQVTIQPQFFFNKDLDYLLTVRSMAIITGGLGGRIFYIKQHSESYDREAVSSQMRLTSQSYTAVIKCGIQRPGDQESCGRLTAPGLKCYQHKESTLNVPNWDAADYVSKKVYTMSLSQEHVYSKNRNDQRKLMTAETSLCYEYNKGGEIGSGQEDDKKEAKEFTQPIEKD
ncbi:hypothetical protein Tco_0530520 [Tanacetum coccineum]